MEKRKAGKRPARWVQLPRFKAMVGTSGALTNPRSTSGFTLIELMIVIAIISVISSVAIPRQLEERQRVNESAAISTLRTLVSGQSLFRDTDRDGDGAFDYALSLLELSEADLIDDALGEDGKRQGYCFVLASHTEDTWHAHANPEVPGMTGGRFFYVNESGVIRFENGTVATGLSPPIGFKSLAASGGGIPGALDEEASEHTIQGCGAAVGPPVSQLLENFVAVALRQLAEQLPEGTSVLEAQGFTTDPDFVETVQDKMDLDWSGGLSMEEMRIADLLNAAREVKQERFSGDPRDFFLQVDEVLSAVLKRYQETVASIIALREHEEPPPEIEIR